MSEAPKPQSLFPRASNTSVLATFLVIICCFLAMGLIVYLAYLPNRGGSETVDMSQVPENQRWQYSPDGRKEHLVQLRANETDKLNHYSWVDQQNGVVRIPVERAMELIVQQHKEASH